MTEPPTPRPARGDTELAAIVALIVVKTYHLAELVIAVRMRR